MSSTPRAVRVRSARSNGSTRRRVTPDRQREIVDRLEALLLSEGFQALTVDDIAARLQCSKSTLYAIAAGKEQLVTVVVKHFFREAARRVEDNVAGVEDPAKRISVYLSSVGAEMRRMSSVCYADMVTFPVTGDIYEHNSRVAARRVRELIAEGVKAGTFRAVHASFVAESVSLLIDGIQQGALLERTGLSSGDAYEEMAQLVLTALLPEPRATVRGKPHMS